MPNWVTVKIKTTKEVLQSVQSCENDFDFNNVIKFTGNHKMDMISLNVERNAQFIIKSNRMLGEISMEQKNYDSLDPNELEELNQMLSNYNSCGFLHQMDFAKEIWGTKWNSCDAIVDLDEGTVSLKTAWSCPVPVFEKLSEQFPNSLIEVKYADEDSGSNCGFFSIQNGKYLSQNIAPRYFEMTEKQKEFWTKYACSINGRDYEELIKEREYDERIDPENEN